MVGLACTLALVMMLDVSHSVDESRWIQQRNGHVASFRTEQVIRHVESTGPIAVSVVVFSEEAEAILQWRVLESREQVFEFANDFEKIERPYNLGFSTDIYNGINISIRLHDIELPCTPERRVIDVAADGVQNAPVDQQNFQEIAEERGITINGIAIFRDDQSSNINIELQNFFNDRIKTSDGFVVVSNGFNDIARAVRRKLEIEILGQITNNDLQIN